MAIDTAPDTTARRTRRAVVAFVDAAVAMEARDPDLALVVLGRLLRDVTDDRDGVDRAPGDDAGLLVALGTASKLTLRGLASPLAARGAPAGGARPDALIDRAVGYGVAPRPAVLAAAWRLDAVRRGDHDRAATEAATSAPAGAAVELLAGAAALLASTLAAGGMVPAGPVGT